MGVVDRIRVPFPLQKGMVESDGEADNSDTSHRIDDSQVRTARAGPDEMDKRYRRRARDEMAWSRIAQIPRPVLRMTPKITKLNRLTVRCD